MVYAGVTSSKRGLNHSCTLSSQENTLMSLPRVELPTKNGSPVLSRRKLWKRFSLNVTIVSFIPLLFEYEADTDAKITRTPNRYLFMTLIVQCVKNYDRIVIFRNIRKIIQLEFLAISFCIGGLYIRYHGLAVIADWS